MTSDELKSIRASLGLTQRGLAEKLFVTREHVAQMERGAKPITTRTAAQIRAVVASNHEV